jgi:hypothetical protein
LPKENPRRQHDGDEEKKVEAYDGATGIHGFLQLKTLAESGE